ncbi:MAG: PadR family transcriptional regulator [Microbacterium sp.]
MIDQLRRAFSGRGGPRMNKGDVRTAVLALLRERPMHGYQLIQQIEQRTGGSWKPSPGSVYPTLQLLADEGLVEVEESRGRKTYSLTQDGAEEAADIDADELPWMDEPATGADGPQLGKAIGRLAQTASQVITSGSQAQQAEAIAVLDDARKRLYRILADG